MFNQKNVMHLLIAKAGVTATSATKLTKYSDISDGEVVMLDTNGTILKGGVNSATYPIIRFAQRSGTNLIFSPYLDKSKLFGGKGQAGTAATQQVDYIGYNGTSGSIDTIDYNDYIVRILLKDTQTVFGNKQMWKFGAYQTSANPTQAEIANALCLNLYHNFLREPEKTIKFEVVCNHAGTAISNDAADTVIGYAGETTITIADATDDDDIYLFAIGDYIRVGTATTAGVYKVIGTTVTAAAGGVLTLDRPLAADVTLAGSTSEYITAAQAAAANFGIKLTGLARTNFKPGVFKYKVNMWDTQLEGFTSTTVTKSTAPDTGKGTYEYVAELEWFAQGNEGKIERLGVPPPTSRADATSGKTYNMITIEYYDDAGKSIVVAPAKQAKQLYIAIDNASANGEAADVMLTGLNSWFGSTLLTNIS